MQTISEGSGTVRWRTTAAQAQLATTLTLIAETRNWGHALGTVDFGTYPTNDE